MLTRARTIDVVWLCCSKSIHAKNWWYLNMFPLLLFSPASLSLSLALNSHVFFVFFLHKHTEKNTLILFNSSTLCTKLNWSKNWNRQMFAKQMGYKAGKKHWKKNTKIEKNDREMMKQLHNKYTLAHTYLCSHTTGRDVQQKRLNQLHKQCCVNNINFIRRYCVYNHRNTYHKWLVPSIRTDINGVKKDSNNKNWWQGLRLHRKAYKGWCGIWW